MAYTRCDCIRYEHIEDVLINVREGQWFGWGNKDKVYENLIIYGTHDKPTQEWLEEEMKSQQDEWDAKQASKEERLASAKSKLEGLGFTSDEIKDAFDL
jgi:hypothetical protein|tara:strand:- start:1385 stop:1681 length:297 start_codon:yes stop_codon:yes gene_type:complete